MVEILQNGEKLVLKLSHSVSVASSYAEFFAQKINVDVRKIETKKDMNIIESIYEIIPINKDAKFIIMIKDDNPYDLSYHIDRVFFYLWGKNWESEYVYNSKYH